MTQVVFLTGNKSAQLMLRRLASLRDAKILSLDPYPAVSQGETAG